MNNHHLRTLDLVQKGNLVRFIYKRHTILHYPQFPFKKYYADALNLILRDGDEGEGQKENNGRPSRFSTSWHQQQDHQSDIVTVSSGISKKHRDNNYQILSVAGMHTTTPQKQNNTKYGESLCDSKNANNVDQSKPTPPGQQVEFLAHL